MVNLKFESKLPEHYIFFYSLGYEKRRKFYSIKEKYNLPVVLPHEYVVEGMKGYKVIDECGPEEFITLVKNSDMVFDIVSRVYIFYYFSHKN